MVVSQSVQVQSLEGNFYAIARLSHEPAISP